MYERRSKEEEKQVSFDERGFSLPLQTIVEGRDRSGRVFRENTTLSYISHHGSSFYLINPVSIGSDLKLAIDLPSNLSDNENLKLIIRGKVAFIEIPKDKDTAQRISIKFENKYIISAEKE